ncbi:hypothetical protein LOZ80_30100 [Paenibacillus sp. HWE-109]|uniref:hypothetical protein n=1 Tax=Paenibacillus sp. HWE-109 TaxID=1306526 RepID=UPI001EDF98B3|nr:hypothetical protein [Paenibacillus sp. HWE-109]UKS25774.1 hypothetical protein LOZ80_30100 [Paenibacillus sp. HWE-109]
MDKKIHDALPDFPKVKEGESKSYSASGKIILPVIKGQENYLIFTRSDSTLEYEDTFIYFKLQ